LFVYGFLFVFRYRFFFLKFIIFSRLRSSLHTWLCYFECVTFMIIGNDNKIQEVYLSSLKGKLPLFHYNHNNGRVNNNVPTMMLKLES